MVLAKIDNGLQLGIKDRPSLSDGFNWETMMEALVCLPFGLISAGVMVSQLISAKNAIDGAK